MAYLTNNRSFPTREAAFRYHRMEGFVVGVVSCGDCGFYEDGIFSPFANTEGMRCKRCGHLAAALKHEFGPAGEDKL